MAANILLGLLLLAGVFHAATVEPHSVELLGYQWLLIGMLGAWSAGLYWGAKRAPWLRPLLAALIIFSLYTPLGRVGVLSGALTDFRIDALDRRLFGFDPSDVAQAYYRVPLIEFFAFFYSFFIPYIHLSLLLNLIARRGDDREAYFTSFVLLYSVSFLGYLFLPAQGPAAFPLLHHHAPIVGGAIYRFVETGVAHTGGYIGAFPSLHVGASVFFCTADFSRDRLRTLLFIPIVVAIAGATIALRYHYVTDIIVGGAWGALVIPLGRYLAQRPWTRREEVA